MQHPRQKFRKKWEHRADHFGRCIYCRLDVRLYIDDCIHGNLLISSRKKRFTRSSNGSFEFLVSLVETDTSARETAKERGTFLHVNFHSLDLQRFIRSIFRTLRSPFAEDLSSIKMALQRNIPRPSGVSVPEQSRQVYTLIYALSIYTEATYPRVSDPSRYAQCISDDGRFLQNSTTVVVTNYISSDEVEGFVGRVEIPRGSSAWTEES